MSRKIRVIIQKFFLPKYKQERRLKIERSCIYLITLFLNSSLVYIFGPTVWNSLPLNLRSIDTLHRFKMELKKYFNDKYNDKKI